jgi:hypothetical protein
VSEVSQLSVDIYVRIQDSINAGDLRGNFLEAMHLKLAIERRMQRALQTPRQRDRLRFRFLKARGFTQAECAVIIGTSRRSIVRWNRK